MDYFSLNEVIGWIGGVCFSVCSFPLVYNVWKTGETRAIVWPTLALWGTGEILMLIYVVVGNYTTGVWQLPLIVNYIFNLLSIIYLIIKKYHYEILGHARPDKLNTT